MYVITKQRYKETYHFLAEKFKSLKSAHGLCAGLNVLEDDMGLSAHLVRLHGHDVQDSAVGGEEGVERGAEVMLVELIGKIGAVESEELSASGASSIAAAIELTFGWDVQRT
jgi:hypothetical protein